MAVKTVSINGTEFKFEETHDGKIRMCVAVSVPSSQEVATVTMTKAQCDRLGDVMKVIAASPERISGKSPIDQTW